MGYSGRSTSRWINRCENSSENLRKNINTKMKMKYGIQDRSTNGDQAYEVKSDMEARPRGDGTDPLWVDTIEQAEAVAIKYPGMSVVDIVE